VSPAIIGTILLGQIKVGGIFFWIKKQTPACFDGMPGDQGEKLLTSYITGDVIVAYAKGYGAIRWES